MGHGSMIFVFVFFWGFDECHGSMRLDQTEASML